MHNKVNKIFSTKRAFVFAGILILICAAGIGLLTQRFWPGNIISSNGNSIPIGNDTNLPQPSAVNSDTQPDKYGIRLKLSDGQPQP